MGRLGTFVAGFLLGGGTVFFTLHYHIVRANDGIHMVPKFSSTFAESYVDIRAFGYQEWTDHHELAVAITKAGKTDLLQGIAVAPLQNAVDNIFNTVNSATQSAQQQFGQPFGQ